MTTRWSMTINHDNDDHADDEMIATVWVCNPHHPHQLAMSQIQNEPKTSHWHSPASRFSLVSFPRSIVKDDLRVEEVQVACPRWGPEFEYRRARPHSWGWQKRSWGTVVRLHPLSPSSLAHLLPDAVLDGAPDLYLANILENDQTTNFCIFRCSFLAGCAS